MRKTCLALLLLPIASLACTTETETEPEDDAASTSAAFSPNRADCSIVRNGGTVTLSCSKVPYRKAYFVWERLLPLTGTFEMIGQVAVAYDPGAVVLHDDNPGVSPVYQLRLRNEYYLPNGATSVDGIARFVPSRDLGGQAAPLVPAPGGCTVKRLGCIGGLVEVRCTGGPGAFYDMSGNYGYAEITLGSGRGTVVKTMSEHYLDIRDGAHQLVTPPGTKLDTYGNIVVPPCLVPGPRVPF